MEQDTEVTRVIFRQWKSGNQGVIAFFPDIEAELGCCMSYEHVGQHGGADYNGCLQKTRPVHDQHPEVVALAAELRSIGYNLKIVRRR